MSPGVLLVAYCVLIVAASLAGGWLPGLVRLTHTRMQLAMSFVSGLMLGVGLLHLLPHALVELNSVDAAMGWMLAGLLVMFFLVRIFHVHEHGSMEDAAVVSAGDDAALAAGSAATAHDCEHEHHDHPPGPAHRWSWIGLAFGLALHTAIDGIALAAAVAAESSHGWSTSLVGLGVFLAVVLHKPLDALSITSMMAAAGWPSRTQVLVNAGFAMMCPLGAALFYFGVEEFAGVQHVLVGSALAFSAGVFICIALGDLLPELHFHSHDRVKLSAALLLGIAFAYGIGLLEPEHAHSKHDEEHAAEAVHQD